MTSDRLTDDELERIRDLADNDIATVRDMRLVLAELERLHSWDGLMGLLDEHWPEDLHPTLDDDPGRDHCARIVSLLRWVDRLRAENTALAATLAETEAELDHFRRAEYRRLESALEKANPVKPSRHESPGAGPAALGLVQDREGQADA